MRPCVHPFCKHLLQLRQHPSAQQWCVAGWEGTQGLICLCLCGAEYMKFLKLPKTSGDGVRIEKDQNLAGFATQWNFIYL